MARFLPSLLLFVGCTISPQPIPPTFNPGGVSVIDPAAEVDTQEHLVPQVIVGAPGTVEPAAGVITSTPLGHGGPVLSEPIREDGSFEIMVEPGDHRLQVRDGEAHSDPIDVRVDGQGLTVLSPEHPCFEIEPRLAYDFGLVPVGDHADLPVTMRNGCDFMVEVSPRFRTEGPFEVLAEPPPTLPAGASMTFRIRTEPTRPGAYEQTMIVDISPDDRRVLTLFVRGASD